MDNAVVAGVGMTHFGRFPERGIGDLAGAAVNVALEDAGIGAAEVDEVYFANAVAGSITGQEMIRAQVALRDTPLAGKPMFNVENACASGSSALHLAWQAVSSGHCEVAIAVGAEKMSHPDKGVSMRALLGGLDVSRMEEFEARVYAESGGAGSGSIFMDLYAHKAREYMGRSGASLRDFAAVASKNHLHGSLNPQAQFRSKVSVDEVLESRSISGPLTLLMCSPIGDGAAAVVVTSAGRGRTLSKPNPRIAASVILSGGLDEEPATTRAALLAYERAGLAPDAIDVAEVHDATASAELEIYEEIGFCAPGEGPRLLASGATTLGGRLPVNTSGGLLSRGHPVGATGVAQVVELVTQLRGSAGDRQVVGARTALAHNAGGYLTEDNAAAAVTILSLD